MRVLRTSSSTIHEMDKQKQINGSSLTLATDQNSPLKIPRQAGGTQQVMTTQKIQMPLQPLADSLAGLKYESSNGKRLSHTVS